MDDPNKRVCGICNHFKDYTCTDFWEGRKVSHFNICAYHSDGDDHLAEDKNVASRKLNKDQVAKIQELYNEGDSCAKLAQRYQISYAAINYHVRGYKET